MTDLITVVELAAYMKQDLDTTSAQSAISGAQKLVRRYSTQEFTTATWTDVRLPVTWDPRAGAVVPLPQRPITGVTSVLVNGSAATYNVDYLRSRLVITSTIPAAPTGLEDQAVVTYTSGAAAAPDDVLLVVKSVAARIYDNPLGEQQWAVDDSSGTPGGEDGDVVALTPGEKSLLADFRRRRLGSLRVL